MTPKYTVHSQKSTTENIGFITVTWNFFTSKDLAVKCYEEMKATGHYSTLREWHVSDLDHMAVVDVRRAKP